MKNNMTLGDLKQACAKAFITDVGNFEEALDRYDVVVIDGKSAVTCDAELNQKRRTFGLYWNKKVSVKNYSLLPLFKRLKLMIDHLNILSVAVHTFLLVLHV